MKDASLILKLSKELKTTLQQEAEKRGMSMSTLVRVAIIDFINKKEV